MSALFRIILTSKDSEPTYHVFLWFKFKCCVCTIYTSDILYTEVTAVVLVPKIILQVHLSQQWTRFL